MKCVDWRARAERSEALLRKLEWSGHVSVQDGLWVLHPERCPVCGGLGATTGHAADVSLPCSSARRCSHDKT